MRPTTVMVTASPKSKLGVVIVDRIMRIAQRFVVSQKLFGMIIKPNVVAPFRVRIDTQAKACGYMHYESEDKCWEASLQNRSLMQSVLSLDLSTRNEINNGR